MRGFQGKLIENIFLIIAVAVPGGWVGRDVFPDAVQFGVVPDNAVVE